MTVREIGTDILDMAGRLKRRVFKVGMALAAGFLTMVVEMIAAVFGFLTDLIEALAQGFVTVGEGLSDLVESIVDLFDGD